MDTMSIYNEKLKSFMAAVNTQIDNKVAKMLEEAEHEKNVILNAAEAEAQIAAEMHFSSKTKKNDNQLVRDISKAELEMKKEVLRHREELTDKVFLAVEDKINEYRKTPKYVDGLVKTLLFMNVQGETEIFMSPDDLKYSDTLRKAVKSDKVTFSADKKIRLGGLSVYNVAKGTITDKTYDLALEEQKQLFTKNNAFAQ